MLFTLEALQAKHGDCLILHYGDPNDIKRVVIDGGPNSRILRPRLETIRQTLPNPEAGLPIRLLMVSHIDEDHIRGVLDLTKRVRAAAEDQEPLPYRIQMLWHNSFDDIVGNGADHLFQASVAALGPASLEGEIPDNLPISHESALVLASVKQGRTLRDDAQFIGLNINNGGGLVSDFTTEIAPVALGDGLNMTVVGPSRTQLRELQKDWDKKLRERQLATPAGQAEAAAYLDKSVYNLASIVVLATMNDKRILLTGDARGDDILSGLEKADVLDAGGRLHVDVLKVPHHGSDRNVEEDFFRRIRADHYVISGDGKYGNPEPTTFKMLFAARGNDAYAIHLTYPIEEMIEDYPIEEVKQLIAAEQATGKQFKVLSPMDGKKSVRLDLLEGYAGP